MNAEGSQVYTFFTLKLTKTNTFYIFNVKIVYICSVIYLHLNIFVGQLSGANMIKKIINSAGYLGKISRKKIKRKKMATLKYQVSGKKNPSEISARFIRGREIDIEARIKIFIDPKHWDKENQKIRNVIAVPNRDELNKMLIELKLAIFDAANFDFANGEILNRAWLEKTIAKFYNRPSGELKKTAELHRVYFTDFCSWWLKEKAPKFKISPEKYMDSRNIQLYEAALVQIKRFEGKNKLKFNDINEVLIDSFSEFLSSEKYAFATAKRMILRFKFFCKRAEAENIKIDQSYTNRVFIKKETEDYQEPYFNEMEIKKIYEHDFSNNPTLDNVRDNLIIGLWTGLRVSDFLSRLNLSNFKEGFIDIKTKKTKTSVSIPIHWMISEILKKRNGSLPNKISDQKFNDHIKTIAEILKFNQVMVGGVDKVDEKTKVKRKVVALYPKHELVTSHICRRSFATNVYGTVPNNTLMSICGWKTEDMMLKYIKKTNREHAETLKKVWASKYAEAN